MLCFNLLRKYVVSEVFMEFKLWNTKARKERERIASENTSIFNQGFYWLGSQRIDVKSRIEESIKETVIFAPYWNHNNPNISETKAKITPKILIENIDTVEASLEQKKKYGSSCLLNFASATTPGGGYLQGSSAQEEGICRRTDLYPILVSQTSLYDWSRKNLRGGLYSNWCYFSPKVIVIRNSNMTLKLPEKIGVLTSPAPNKKRFSGSEEEIKKSLEERCELILKTAIACDQKNLVLGAFGCGAFGNDPIVVANIWKNLLNKYPYFENITFAILCRYEQDNIEAFKKVFDIK